MKKTVYTIAFIALFSVMSHAQDNNAKQPKPAATTPAQKETVNPDGTLSPAQPAAVSAPANESAVEAPKPDDKGTKNQKGGTRMAITEKGVPASKKPAEPKKAEPAKTEKH